MHWNETRGELERWYLNSAALQNVVGGRKPMIKAYLQAHAQEIEAHHQQFEPPIPRPIIANRFPLRSFLRCQNKRQPILGDGRRRRPLRKRSLRSKPSLWSGSSGWREERVRRVWVEVARSQVVARQWASELKTERWKGRWCPITSDRTLFGCVVAVLLLVIKPFFSQRGVYPQGAGNLWRRMWKKG